MPEDPALLPGRTRLLALLLAAGAVAAHAGWLGGDQEYDLDPVTGARTGPYEAWQVFGCALTVGALALVAGLRRRPGLALGVVPPVFTPAWSRAVDDASGLWVVGAVLVLIGSTAGVTLVAYPADAWAGRGRRQPR